MQVGDIVTVVTISGEYVGKLTEYGDTHIVMKDPRMILQSQDGQMGFAKGIAVTGHENPTEVQFQTIVFMTPTNKKVAEAYEDATSSIKVAPAGIVS